LIEAAQMALAIPSGAIRSGMYGEDAKPSRLAYRPLVTSAHGFGFQRLKPINEATDQKPPTAKITQKNFLLHLKELSPARSGACLLRFQSDM